MSPSRPLALALALTLGALAARSVEAETVAEAALAIPFAHRVGERWRLRFEAEQGDGAHTSPVVVSEAEALVLSPYGRDLLVELRWTSVTEGGTTTALWPRREQTVEALDQRGGGRLLLRVDVRGSALALLNEDEVRAAAERHAAQLLGPQAWADVSTRLLAEWNVAYGACGVALVPDQTRSTPLSGSEQARGEDERVLRVEGEGVPRAWAVHARTAVRDLAPGAATLSLTSSTRYDLASGRLSGWRLSVRAEAQRRSVERLRFAELPLLDDAAALARR